MWSTRGRSPASSRVVATLKRRGVATPAQLATWYRVEVARGAVVRGIGPKSLAAIAAWLDEREAAAK